ncbi:MAG: YbaN family protein [Eubacteriales bacterium]
MNDNNKKQSKGIFKVLYIVCGCIALGLGALGAILPMLPTFPFLLLSLFCFGKSSDKLTNWLISTKLYEDNLKSWIEKKGMSKEAKLRICTTVTCIMAFSFLMMKNVPVGRMALLIVWLVHIIFFLFFVKNEK